MVPTIPIGTWVRDWIIDPLRGNPLFDAFRWIVSALIDALETIFLFLPALGMVAIFVALAFWLRGYRFALFTAVAFLLVESIGMWEPAMETLALVLVASFFSVAIGIPVGILASRRDAVAAGVRPILDFMQTLPAFVYLIPAIVFFGVGPVPGAIATLVFSMPPAVRLTNLGIRGVDKEIVEAARAFGAKPRQILFRIQIPLALPTIMAGVNQVIMLALSMVVIAGMAGAGGLGAEVFRAIGRVNIPLGVESGLAVVIVAIFLDRISEAIGQRGDSSS
jgi:ABC-type proline/glycine betaine transport system permease subunit